MVSVLKQYITVVNIIVFLNMHSLIHFNKLFTTVLMNTKFNTHFISSCNGISYICRLPSSTLNRSIICLQFAYHYLYSVRGDFGRSTSWTSRISTPCSTSETAVFLPSPNLGLCMFPFVRDNQAYRTLPIVHPLDPVWQAGRNRLPECTSAILIRSV